MELVGEAIAGIAGSRPQRASALNHELRDHAVEKEPVVKRPFHFLPCARIFEFLCAFCEADEIRDGVRRFGFEQAGDNRALRSVKNGISSWFAGQGFLLRIAKCVLHYRAFRPGRPVTYPRGSVWFWRKRTSARRGTGGRYNCREDGWFCGGRVPPRVLGGGGGER